MPQTPPHGGPGEVEEIEHNPQADAHALGLYECIRRGDRNAVDYLAGLAKDRGLAEAEQRFETGEEVFFLRRYITYGEDVVEREVNGIAETAVQGRAQSNWTALHVAAQCGNADATGTLVGQEAAASARGNGARTSLHEAALSGAANVVALLAQAGTDPDARCTAGLTPLHVACRHGHAAVVAALCDAGARAWDCLGDPEAAHALSKDVYGETVLGVCRRYKRRKCAAELRGHRSRVLCEVARAEALTAADDDGALYSPASLERGEELYEQASAAVAERLKQFEAVYSIPPMAEAERQAAEAAAEAAGEDAPLPDGKTLARLFDRAAKRFRGALVGALVQQQPQPQPPPPPPPLAP